MQHLRTLPIIEYIAKNPVQRLLFLSLGLTLSALIVIARESGADFAQDYAAAWAWWHGINPSAPTADIYAVCCPQDLVTGAIQNAHPPFSTVLILPFGLLPFTIARALWLLLSSVLIVLSWRVGRLSATTCAATACLWIFGLSLGVLEPIVFLLLAFAFRIELQMPIRAAALVGLSAAIKIYPILLLAGFWVSGRWRAALVGTATAIFATLVGDVIIGQGALRAWLEYIPLNTLRYIDTIGNPLIRLARLVEPTLPPTPIALVIAGLLTLPLILRWRQGITLRQMLPVMLLSSPLIGAHYVALISLLPPGRVALVCLACVGALGILLRLAIIPFYPVVEMLFLSSLLLGLFSDWRRMLLEPSSTLGSDNKYL